VNVRRRCRRLFAALALLAATATSADLRAQDVVQIRMRGRYFAEPATVRLTIAVQPDADNRMLVIQADGDRLYRSSQFPLDGSKEQRIHTVEFKNLPAGNYVVRAEVLSNASVRGSAEELLVVGDPAERGRE
jgi:hypothetical protein